MSVFQVDDDGELVRDRQGFVRVSGLEEIRQGITVRLRLFQGEIPTKTTAGMPWLALMSLPTTETQVAQTVAERGVLTQPGVVAVDDVSVVIDPLERWGEVTYSATGSLAELRRRVLIDGSVDVRL